MLTPQDLNTVRVLVSGAENGGTGYVASILREAGADVTHLAVPHVHDWRAAHLAAATCDHIVVVIRGLYAHTRSLEDRSGELHRQGWCDSYVYRRMALAAVTPLLVDHRCTVVTYESLASETERRALLEHLGLDADAVTTVFEDRNVLRYAA